MASESRNDKLDSEVGGTAETSTDTYDDVLPGPAGGGEPPVDSTPYSHDELIRMHGAQFVPSDQHWVRRVKISLQLRQDALTGGKVHVLASEDPASSRQMRYAIPVTVYVSDSEAHEDVQEAVTQLVSTFGFEMVDALPALHGSWYRAFVAHLREALTSYELADRLQKLERGVELHLLHKKQAEIDSLQGEAVAKLLTALEGTPCALVQIGSVLVVKVDGVPVVRNLTQRELTYLERNPSLLRNPAAILDALQEASPSVPVIGSGSSLTS